MELVEGISKPRQAVDLGFGTLASKVCVSSVKNRLWLAPVMITTNAQLVALPFDARESIPGGSPLAENQHQCHLPLSILTMQTTQSCVQPVSVMNKKAGILGGAPCSLNLGGFGATFLR